MSKEAAADILLVVRWFVFEIMGPLVGMTIAGCLIMAIVCCIAQGIEALVQ